MASYLKWAGGKTRLCPELTPRLPASFNRWIEPFFGSGAMFFGYYETILSDAIFGEAPPEAIACDYNRFLVNTHLQVRDNLDSLSEELRLLEKAHAKAPETTYLEKRQIATQPYGDYEGEKVRAAANFIYINKTCFNGLWRVNKKGEFNVPFNGVESVNLVTAELRSCSRVMSNYLTLFQGDFEAFCDSNVQKGDFVFLDPPYIPLTQTSNFVGYTEDGWGREDNLRLASILKLIDSRGAYFMMTNSSSSAIYEYFGDWKIDIIKAPRFIKAITEENGTRDKVDETVITNY